MLIRKIDMTHRLTALALSLLLATSAVAQDATTQTPTTDAPATDAPVASPEALSMGQEVTDENAVGSTYLVSDHGDWQLRCVKMPEGQKDPCNLYQLLKDTQGNDVAEISLFHLPDGGQAEAGATIITPLETLLTEQVSLSVDGGAIKRYPFTFCAQIGCFSRIGLTSGEIAGFKAGKAGKIVIVPVAAPDKKVELVVSLNGFTAGYDAVSKANAE